MSLYPLTKIDSVQYEAGERSISSPASYSVTNKVNEYMTFPLSGRNPAVA